MTWEQWMESELGYKCKTTFWSDFSIADLFGIENVKETFKIAFEEWKTNYEFLTELVIVLNHKISFHYKRNNELSKTYDELWRQADNYALENLKGKELEYFLETTD